MIQEPPHNSIYPSASAHLPCSQPTAHFEPLVIPVHCAMLACCCCCFFVFCFVLVVVVVFAVVAVVLSSELSHPEQDPPLFHTLWCFLFNTVYNLSLLKVC